VDGTLDLVLFAESIFSTAHTMLRRGHTFFERFRGGNSRSGRQVIFRWL